jgi:hypothetical protein
LNWFLGFQVLDGALLMMGQAEGMEGAMRGAWAMASRDRGLSLREGIKRLFSIEMFGVMLMSGSAKPVR